MKSGWLSMGNEPGGPLEAMLGMSGLKPSECRCEVCRNKCAEKMCLGTPDDILRLIRAGFGGLMRILPVKIITIPQGHLVTIETIQINIDDGGCCLYKDGMCLVHDMGLKPTEGRYFLHPKNGIERRMMTDLIMTISLEWAMDHNHHTVESCFASLLDI